MVRPNWPIRKSTTISKRSAVWITEASWLTRMPSPSKACFRFPYGACTPAAIEAAEKFGLRVVQWDVSSSDPWKGQSVTGMVATVLRRVRPGSIVLFHANGRGWKTDDAIPILIRKLRTRKYRFVTVSELLRSGRPVYSNDCYDHRPGDVNRYRQLASRLERAYDRFYKKVGRGRPSIDGPDVSKFSFAGPLPARNDQPNRTKEPRAIQRSPEQADGWQQKTTVWPSGPEARPDLLREKLDGQ